MPKRKIYEIIDILREASDEENEDILRATLIEPDAVPPELAVGDEDPPED